MVGKQVKLIQDEQDWATAAAIAWTKIQTLWTLVMNKAAALVLNLLTFL